MGDFKKLLVAQPPRVASRTPESRYWRKFRVPVLVKDYAAITSVDFSPVDPHDFAVTSSTRIQIFNPRTNSVRRTISRFQDVAYCGSYRRDGKLLVAGGEDGQVQIFDASSRAVLRSHKSHQGAVHFTKFCANLTHVVSAGDDGVVRCWDMPTQEEVRVYGEHKDYVRAGCMSEDDPFVWATGSYDHTVKLWDSRTDKSVMTLSQDHPVESMILFPGSTLLISSGQNEFRIWDILAGGRLLRLVSNHQKTITSMCLDSSRSRLLTGSLDQHIKIYSVQDYRVVHSIRHTAPILCVGLSQNDSHLIAGMANGLLSIRHRVVKADPLADMLALGVLPKERTGGNGSGSSRRYRYFMRGTGHRAKQDDLVVHRPKSMHLRAYEKFLKKFQYKNALDAVLVASTRPIIVVSLLEELVYRRALTNALADRDDVSLEPLLKFLVKHIVHRHYSAILMDVCNAVLDLYSGYVGQSMVVDELLLKLRTKVAKEVEFQKQMFALMGSIEMVFASSTFVGSSTNASDHHSDAQGESPVV